jgi:hypothetical protein
MGKKHYKNHAKYYLKSYLKSYLKTYDEFYAVAFQIRSLMRVLLAQRSRYSRWLSHQRSYSDEVVGGRSSCIYPIYLHHTRYQL